MLKYFLKNIKWGEKNHVLITFLTPHCVGFDLKKIILRNEYEINYKCLNYVF